MLSDVDAGVGVGVISVQPSAMSCVASGWSVSVAAGFALKRTRAVYTRPGKDAKLCLSEGVLGARPGGVRMLPPLAVWTGDGKRELAKIYGTERTRET